MFQKNRIVSLGLVLALSAGLLAGCANSKAESSNKAGQENEVSANATEATSQESTDAVDQLSVVCTIFPEYDWAKEVLGELGEQCELTLLLDDGVDLHNYQPTAEDISKIADCDLFVYVGGESDGWVEDALKEATNPNMQVINLLDTLGNTVKEEEVVEGMQAEEEEEASDSKEEEIEYDEHVWLSLKNAKTLVNAISTSLQTLDPENASAYQTNCDAYTNQLTELDGKYQTTVDQASKDTVLFGDRFPFRYMVDDYGLNYYAAFVGCSAESEASFETVIFLARKVDELGLKHVMVIENSDQKIANTVIQNTTSKDQDILVLDSMQSVTSEDIDAGETYLSVMTKNQEVLEKALND